MSNRNTVAILVGFVLALSGIDMATAAVPDCPTRYCDESFVVERLGTNVLDYPVVEHIPIDEKYGVCNKETCCNTAQCSITVSAGSADAGWWHNDAPGSPTLTLPTGFAVAGAGSLMLNGNLTVAVPASTEVYSIGNCSRIGLEIGAVYKNELRSFDAKIVCSEDGEECDEVLFTGFESIDYFVEAPGELGFNGEPYSNGCGSLDPNPCADPANNTCPD